MRHGFMPDFEPEVSLIISAYNEEDFIEKKIQNSLELDYPAEKLNHSMITDGSNDKTADIIRNYPQIQLLHQSERKGKGCRHEQGHEACPVRPM